jgi:hypothetical protein
MKKIVKKTYLFFIFLAIFIYNAHMIIPHDHHQGDWDFCQENSVSGRGASNNHGLPFHCHAFNDMASEKAVQYLVVTHFESTDLIPGILTDQALVIRQSFLLNVIDQVDQPLEQHVFNLIPFRAPPTIC